MVVVAGEADGGDAGEVDGGIGEPYGVGKSSDEIDGDRLLAALNENEDLVALLAGVTMTRGTAPVASMTSSSSPFMVAEASTAPFVGEERFCETAGPAGEVEFGLRGEACPRKENRLAPSEPEWGRSIGECREFGEAATVEPAGD